jgi:hypothetical protein
MFDFNRCHPIALNDLVRIGNKNDGGYILAKRQIEKTDMVLSFGIRDDWTFEEGFLKRKDVKIYSFDYSTKDLPFLNQKFTKKLVNVFLGVGVNILRLNPRRIKNCIETFRRAKNFYKFFDGKNRCFIPKFLGRHDDEQNVCFNTIFKRLGNNEDLSVFLKMDIEGAEFQTLPELIPFLSKLNGMAIEFHIGSKVDEFDKLLDLFSEDFYIAHVHGCNYGGYIQNTNVPSVLEMTFINKKAVSEKIILSRLEYPVKGLDAPCHRKRKDYILKFTD